MQLMISFPDLPLEFLPLILAFVLRPHQLSVLCRVNRTFYEFTAPLLYHRIALYAWQREGKARVICLFNTLSTSTRLAELVHRLELREFPKAFTRNADFTLDTVLSGLRNCTNLKACTWTREGSLSSDILLALQTSPSHPLEELEINGGSNGNYDPCILKGFTRLKKLSLIMPSPLVVYQLKRWMERTGQSLRSLTIIGKASSIPTDSDLEELAPHVCNLTHLYITGCVRVTSRGIGAIFSQNRVGILGLGLEGISPRFEIQRLTEFASTLASLTSMTIATHQFMLLESYLSAISSLLVHCPLQSFHIYSTDLARMSSLPLPTTSRAPIPSSMTTTDKFWSHFVETHGSRLVRVSIHRMLVSTSSIEAICKKCVKLEQFFVVVDPESLETLASHLEHAKHLRTLHINYPITITSLANDIPVGITPAEALSIVGHCSPTLEQFGCNARVWQVLRSVEPDSAANGGLRVRPALVPYESHDVPEQFLVVRT